MSMAPNNPFESDFQGGNRYGSQPPQGNNSVWLWVLGIVGGVFLLGCIVCCGATFFVYRTTTSAMSDIMTEEVASQFGDQQVFKDNIGEVQSAGPNFGATITEAQKAAANEGKGDVTTMVVDVQGDKGSGKIYYRTNQKDQTARAVLVMEDGSEFELEITDSWEESIGEMGEEISEEPGVEAATESTSEIAPTTDAAPTSETDDALNEPDTAGS
ncbi:Coa1/Tim21 domain-containing protein [Stieleria varia]|uniref:Cytochrome oxidase complex assembly protein 1 n=1 Tax=Stieleria varia TaxID=2528005 RepID=A0A5C5ZYR4_9BACT|nr:hypothetical protein [Stieleria varia]TWT92419.1 hypothetical protein Pla52n_62930 [Stieleria varia]